MVIIVQYDETKYEIIIINSISLQIPSSDRRCFPIVCNHLPVKINISHQHHIQSQPGVIVQYDGTKLSLQIPSHPWPKVLPDCLQSFNSWSDLSIILSQRALGPRPLIYLHSGELKISSYLPGRPFQKDDNETTPSWLWAMRTYAVWTLRDIIYEMNDGIGYGRYLRLGEGQRWLWRISLLLLLGWDLGGEVTEIIKVFMGWT